MQMTPDMCVPCGDGFLNIRVGALIEKDENCLWFRVIMAICTLLAAE